MVQVYCGTSLHCYELALVRVDYKTIGLIIWSNKCNKVLTDGSVVYG